MQKKKMSKTAYSDYAIGIERAVATGDVTYLRYTIQRIMELYDSNDKVVAGLIGMCKMVPGVA